MGAFEEQFLKFWQEFGKSRKMVLSTSLDDIVTSRTMSVIQRGHILYFQTDRTFRKYRQLKNNAHVALCIDNIQIEGLCSELGRPVENEDFCHAYRECFPAPFERYTLLENERLFAVAPTFVERWVYQNNVPYLQIFDVKNREYRLERYGGAQ